MQAALVPVDGPALASLAPWRVLLACPSCGGPVAIEDGALACGPCKTEYPIENGIPALRRRADARTELVRDFYTVAPFPGYPPQDSLSSLRARAGRSAFVQLLDRAIAGDACILEVGCGTGQMSLYLATANRRIVGADLTRSSLELGAAAARRFGIKNVQFIETDLRSPGLRAEAFDLVYCSGVLHHTPNPRASFAALAKLVKPGGIVVLGLYNRYARFPHRLRRGLARLSRYRLIPFDPVLRDRAAEPARRQAWLRDQYQHPEEHRHTVREVRHWFAENAIELLRTYPSALVGTPEPRAEELFQPAVDHWGFEAVLAQLAWTADLWSEGGLFIAIGRRTDGPARD